MYINSNLIMTKKNIEASKEYLEKAKAFHHLWQPEEELVHINKAIKMHEHAIYKEKTKEKVRAKIAAK